MFRSMGTVAKEVCYPVHFTVCVRERQCTKSDLLHQRSDARLRQTLGVMVYSKQSVF